MSTHDVLAYAIATEAVRRLRAGSAPWNLLFSANAYITASRSWPVPDFVLVDEDNNLTIGAEFKPPGQTKREYLTGLGQAIAYSKDFDYSLLVLPEIADDRYAIADHVVEVMNQPAFSHLPVGIITYDPRVFSPHSPAFAESRFFSQRAVAPIARARLDTSFYAKWRESSAEEIFKFLSYTYDEMRAPTGGAALRERAFGLVWRDVQAGNLWNNWGNLRRTYADTVAMRTNVAKNYRNFLTHIGWTNGDGALTKEGFNSMQIGTLFGPRSRPFLDTIATATLLPGKHLVLFNAISEFQDNLAMPFPAEIQWLQLLEAFLETKGLLKRNPERAAVAVRGAERGFLKAEKQLWRCLELVIPHRARVFHPGRGFIFNWARIAELVQSASSV